VGIAVDLLTNWTPLAAQPQVYLMYDGNVGTVVPHPRLVYPRRLAVPHFPADEAGDPVFKPL
jgi:hypothetical protein